MKPAVRRSPKRSPTVSVAGGNPRAAERHRRLAQASLRERQRSERAELILEAARTVFAEDGYAAFSSRRVAAVAGITLSTLQHYFSTHQALRLAAIDSLIGLYPARYRAMLADTTLTPRRRLEMLVDDTLEAVSDPAVCGFIFQAFALAVHDSAVGRLVESHYADYVAIVADMIRLHRPSLSSEEAAALATLFTGQMDGMMFFEFRGGTSIPAFSRLRPLLKERLMSLLDANEPGSSVT